MNGTCREYQDQLLALIEGSLNKRAQAEVLAHVHACPACQKELAWLRAVSADLETIGAAIVEGAPEPNLVDSVMAAVAKGRVPARVVSMASQPASRSRFWRWAGLAAATVIVFGLFASLHTLLISHDSHSPLARNTAPRPTEPQHPAVTAPTPEKSGKPGPGGSETLQQVPDVQLQEEGEPAEPGASKDVRNITLQDILAARREAPAHESALARLTQWAALAPDRARALVESADTPPEAIVGASQSLPSEEREGVLLAAVGHFVSQPYPNFELAKAEIETPAPKSAPDGQLLKLRQLDGENAVPLYMEAKLRLDQGDVAGALELLRQAQTLQRATAYAGESANARAQALIQSGVGTDVARSLAAMTAGTGEYNYLFDLGKSLLDYGQSFSGQGDNATAQQLYDAVQRFGQQVADSSSYSQERLAGLDLQRSAIDLLGSLYADTGSQDNIEQVTADTNQLADGIQALSDIVYALNDLFKGNIDENFLRRISDIILRVGDVNVFNSLPHP